MSNSTFTFYNCNDSVRLKVWNNYEAIYDQHYLLTYTIQECLEDWCDHQGYNFISHSTVREISDRIAGTFNFVVLKDKIVMDTIIEVENRL